MSHITLDTLSSGTSFVYEAFTLFRPPFQVCSTTGTSTTFESETPQILLPVVWAVTRSLATTKVIVVYFLFLQVLRCFSSLGSPHDTYVFIS